MSALPTTTRPTLVLTHGMLGSPATFDELRPRLVGLRVHAVTLPGHAGDRRPLPQSFEAAVDQLAGQLDAALGSAPVNLVGYSLGARIALGLCARHPRRFHRAVLISVHPGLTDDAARIARRADDEALARLVETEGMEALVDLWEQRPIFASQRRLRPDARARQRATRLDHDPASIAAALRRLGLAEMPSYRDALLEHAARISLLVGAGDDKFLGIARALGQRIPALAVDVVPDAGHNPLLDAPDATAAYIRARLDDPRPPVATQTSTEQEHRR